MTSLKSIPLAYHIILVLVVSTLAIWQQSKNYEPHMRTGDSYIYLSIAKDFVDKGMITNGVFGKNFPEKGRNGEGHFFTPVYPVFLSFFMHFDKNFYENAACHIASKNGKEAEKCGNDYTSVIIGQTIISALTAALIWLTAYLLTKNLALSWLSLLIGILSKVYGQYATEIMTEVLLFPFFTLASLAAALAWQYRDNIKKSGWLWVLSGILWGAATLTRPAYSYLIYAGVFFLYVAALFITKQGIIKSLRYPVLLLAGFILCVGPWVLRNGISSGEYTISEGYGPHVLTQRLAYNDMTWQEWGASFIYRLPDFGDKLAENLFGKGTYERFDYENKKNGFFYIGHTSFRAQLIEEAGGRENLMPYIIKNYLLPNLPKHIMTTLSLAFNGIWIGKYWALVVLPLFGAALIFAWRKNWQELIILSFPGWFMVGFHAFTSVNVTRYNMTLVPSLSLAAAWVLMMFFCWLKRKYTKEKTG
ncbi:MAG TPA: glycosyltransferase family 39 protein [Alphaproteobacteria bacterium]|nr:glycosyltransferase family 39 protein [Alphaproteobacteria bacterium]